MSSLLRAIATGFAQALLLVAGLALGLAAAGADIVMNPYLQAVDTGGVTVLVECNSTVAASVDFGTTASYGSTASTASTKTTTNTTYVHRVRLTGLAADTLYHYRARHGASTTGDFTFRTAVAPGTPYRFAFLADFRTNTAPHDRVAQRVLNTDQPRVAFYGGDLCNDSTYAVFKSEFLRANELALAARVPFFNAAGNHEGWSTNTQAFTEAPASASGTQAYYSLDYGDVHVLVLNNQVSDSPGSAQATFAQADLAASVKPWKIVVVHYPAYCAGGHNEDADMKALTTSAFEPNGVDLVLAGHSHFYQHNLVNGIHHMVIGTVGAPQAAPGTASYTVKSVQDYCYGILDVTTTTLDMAVYNDYGTVLDTLHLSKAFVAPTGLAATAVSPSRIDLAWNDNATGETRYRIERAPVGGAFAFLANAAANATGYSDTGLAANTTWRYQVRAESDADTSGWSNTAVATTLDDGGGGTVDVRVDAGSDDAEEHQTGTIDLTSTDLELTQESDTQVIGVRFFNVTVPPGAPITQAYIQFKVDETGNVNPVALTIAAEASDDPVPFTTATNSITSRPKTTATAAWSPPDWTVVGAAGADQRTTDLSAVLQQVVNRPGWRCGNHLAAIITGTGKRVAEAYDGDVAGAPLLHVVYGGALPAAPSALAAEPVSESRVLLAWTDNASNETGFLIQRKTDSGGTYATIATVPTNVTAYSDTGLAGGTTYYYRVRASNVTGNSAWCTEAYATTLPPPWVTQDIGSVGVDGRARYDAGLFTLKGSGADIWGTADAFRFVYRPLTGDGAIQARVVSVQNTNAWAKTGVMIRESLAPGSRHAMMALTPGNGLSFQRRTATDGTSASTSGGAATAPRWVRVVRQGDTLSAYASSDGASWTAVGSDTVAMAAAIVVGLPVTSHDNAALCAALVDNVAVSPNAPPTGLAATATSTSQVGLTWTDNAANEAGFQIERKTGSGGTFVLVASVGADVTSWSDSGLAPDTLYVYRVRASNATGASSWSNEAEAATQAQIGIPLVAGYTLVALPLDPALPAMKAADLLQSVLASGIPCTRILRFTGSGYDVYTDAGAGNNFDVKAGEGYFLRCSLPGSWQVTGRRFAAASVPLALETGYNLIGLPLEPFPLDRYTASAVLAEVASDGGEATRMLRFNGSGYTVYTSAGIGVNFAMLPGEGYFIRCSKPSTWTVRK